MRHAHANQSQYSRPSGCLYMPVASKTNYRLVADADLQPLQAIGPVQAYADFRRVLGLGTVRMTGVCGPGDALADAANTMAYLRMVRDEHPEVGICLTTIGLGGQEWAEEFGRLGLNQVAILVDTVSSAVADKLYAWIRPGTKTLPRAAALDLLLCKQAEAVRAFKEAGVRVVVLTTVQPGVNDHEVGVIARTMAALGADSMHVRLGRGLEEEVELLERLRVEAREFLALSENPEDLLVETSSGHVATVHPVPSGTRPFVAVTSSDAQVVDMHLGQASQFLIYGPKNGAVSLIGTRPAPAAGSGPARWDGVAEILSDCAYLRVASCGQSPRKSLQAAGLTVIVAEGGVDGLVDKLYGGGKKPRGKNK